MSVIADVFAHCRLEKRAAFIPFIVAGDPDLRTTVRLVEALAAGGADLIELGVPFSDPIADGPTNQKAATRALKAGTKLSGVLEVVARTRSTTAVPIVLFTYFNPIHARGVRTFAEQAAASGVDGVLCVDLPPEEAAGEYLEALADNGIDAIFLLAPTSTKERVRRVAAASRGFVYYVSRTGVTGDTGALPKSLLKEVKRLRKRVGQPLVVGFGITTPEQVAALGKVSDGVVVGSELVRIVERLGADDSLPAVLEARARELSSALGGKRRRAIPAATANSSSERPSDEADDPPVGAPDESSDDSADNQGAGA